MSTNTCSYTPGTSVIDITAPGGIEALLDFHRATFGDARMEADADAAASAQAAADAAAAAAGGEPKLNEHGFPDATPWKDMKPEHQVAYWRHQSQNHEKRATRAADYDTVKAERDALRAAGLTDSEKAIEEARTKAAAEAATAERSKLAPRLVEAEFKALVAGRIPADRLKAIIAPLDHTKFLTGDGEVDTDKVQEYVDGLAPDGKKWPDMGQGHRGSSGKTTGVGAGRSLYEDRRPKSAATK